MKMVFQNEKIDGGSKTETKIRKIYTVTELEAQTLGRSDELGKFISKFEAN